MTHDGITNDGITHDGARRALAGARPAPARSGPVQDVHHHTPAPGPTASPNDGGELGRTPQALLGRQHGEVRAGQAVSSARPLRRRAETIARPARVRIRSRNPCTRARRRLFGWNVRLPLATV